MEEKEKKVEETAGKEGKSCKICACGDLRTVIIAFLVSVIVVAGYHVGRICVRRYLKGRCQTTRAFKPCRCEMRRFHKFGPGEPGGPGPRHHRRGKPGRPGRKPWMNKPAAECGEPAPAAPAAPEAVPPAPAPKPAPEAAPKAAAEAAPKADAAK